MIRIIIKIIAAFLIWQLVVAPIMGKGLDLLNAFKTLYWWMSPGANGW